MKSLLFIAVAGDNKVVAARQEANGNLSFISETEVLGGPEMLAYDPGKQCLFVGCHPRHNEEQKNFGEFRIYSFHVDLVSGLLEQTNYVTVPHAPVYLSTDPSGDFLLSAYYQAGGCALHEILSDGTIGEQLQWIPTGGGAHSIGTDPFGQYVYLPHIAIGHRNLLVWQRRLSPEHLLQSAPNTILQFILDRNQKQLIRAEQFMLAGERGGGPRHFQFHPFLNMVYFTNEQGCSVSAYCVNRDTGALTPVQYISAFPEDDKILYNPKASCSTLRIASSGKYLYVLIRETNGVVCFAIDNQNGKLKKIQTYQLESVPREMELSSDGSFLYIMCWDSGKIGIAEIGNDGKIRHIMYSDIGHRPAWILEI